MDPLSITANVIALIKAIKTAKECLENIRRSLGAESLVLDLLNEVRLISGVCSLPQPSPVPVAIASEESRQVGYFVCDTALDITIGCLQFGGVGDFPFSPTYPPLWRGECSQVD
jgi:hypothetical protein